MRTWRGAVTVVDAERSLTHQAGTGVRESARRRATRALLSYGDVLPQ